MKALIAGSLIALTLGAAAVETATPADALGIRIGPRGVGIGIGRRPFVRRGFGYRRGPVIRRGYRRGFRRF